jgi:hypothetical protein
MRYFPTTPRRVRLLLVCLGVATGVLAQTAGEGFGQGKR